MKEYEAYLFDADGTLIDTKELIYQSFKHMTTALGVPSPDRRQVYALVGLPMRPQIEIFCGSGRGEDYYAEAYAIYQTFHMREYHRYLGVFPGVREGLAALQDLGKSWP